MNVNKLTLTSIIGAKYKVIINSPETDVATTLIKERLSSRNGLYNNTPKVIKKLPSQLKGLVNPKYHVGDYRKFDINA